MALLEKKKILVCIAVSCYFFTFKKTLVVIKMHRSTTHAHLNDLRNNNYNNVYFDEQTHFGKPDNDAKM